MSVTDKLLDVMGDFPKEHSFFHQGVVCRSSYIRDGIVTKYVDILTSDGDFIPSIIQHSEEGADSRPAILCLHQTTEDPLVGKEEPAGISGDRDLAYGYELACDGFVVLMPDYPGFGKYRLSQKKIYKEYGYGSITLKAVLNHMTAISFLESVPFVEKTKIGCIGHSLGGTNAIFLSCFDPRVKAVAVSCGFTTFVAYADSRPEKDLRGWSRPDKYMPLIKEKYRDNPKNIPFGFGEIFEFLCPIPLFISAAKKDDIFSYNGVSEIMDGTEMLYKKMGMGNNLKFCSPDVGHEFPFETRKMAYEFFKIHLVDKAYKQK